MDSAPRAVHGLCVVGLLLIAAISQADLALGTATYDLHIYSYCPNDGTTCGHPDPIAYAEYMYDAVQELNLEWRSVGISFRPKIIFPIVHGSTYESLSYCYSGDGPNELSWRQQVAFNDKKAITLMLRDPGGPKTCCSTVPSPDWDPGDPNNYGLFCDARRSTAREEGALLAHEMGHHFCLPHTWRGDSSGTAQDTADTPGGAPDWDLDLDAGIDDTPADLQPKENYKAGYSGLVLPGRDVLPGPAGTNISGHEWCDFTNLSGPGLVDTDSPHNSFHLVQCWQQVGAATVPFNLGTTAQWAMASGYGALGRGPFVIGGQLFPAFSKKSKDRILDCKSDLRVALPEVCGSLGGDTDSDGICDSQDNCKGTMNTSQKNTDGDSLGNACDLSIYSPLLLPDADADGIGLLTDLDNDGDGCADVVDQHPINGQMMVGTTLWTLCGVGVEPTYASEGIDSDGDGFLNCGDFDDDNDGLCDEGGPLDAGTPGTGQTGCQRDLQGTDACPLQPGTGCHVISGTPPCPPDWLLCTGAGCDPFFVKVMPAGDPGQPEIGRFDRFQIFNRSLFLERLPDRALSERAGLLRGLAADSATPAATLLRLEIWSRDDNSRVAIVSEYMTDHVQTGDVTVGRFLAVTPGVDRAGSPTLAVTGTFARAHMPTDPPLRDDDDDTWPDAWDNCTQAHNPLQTDADHDGFGNACDADLNGDLIVDPLDVDAVVSCDGADLDLFLPEEEDPTDPPTPVQLEMARRCGPADLDENKIVGSADALLAIDAFNQPPGPTLNPNPTPQCAVGVECDDGDPCTEDLCSGPTDCLNVARTCSDNDPCTTDSCDTMTGDCLHAPPPCDDGNPCTLDACDPAIGGCTGAPVLDGTACDDGNACTIREDCQMGQCVTSLIVSCNDRNPCTPDFCDPGTGECLTEPPACDDGNPCTVDSCTIDGCDHQTLPEGSQCNDGNPCTLVETCQTGQCSAVSTRNCSDMDPCTRDQCDQDTGGCVQEATSCDDDVPLTDDSCDPGTGDCLHAPVVPQAVMSLDFISPTTMRWLPSPGASRWNTYRGTIPSGLMGNAARPDPYDHICFDSADLVGDGPTTATDFHTPSPGSAFYYVASGENALLEGPAVEDSAGGSFYPPNPCLTP